MVYKNNNTVTVNKSNCMRRVDLFFKHFVQRHLIDQQKCIVQILCTTGGDLNWQSSSRKPTPVTTRPPPERLNGIRTDEIPVQLTSPCPRSVETSHNTPHFVLTSHGLRLLGYVSSLD